MNPRIPADAQETARWLAGFVRTHAKRENARIEALVDQVGPRDDPSFAVRLLLDGRLEPPPAARALELRCAEVAAGRSQLAWCSALAERIRALARTLDRGARAAG
jgi:hypothetical protein